MDIKCKSHMDHTGSWKADREQALGSGYKSLFIYSKQSISRHTKISIFSIFNMRCKRTSASCAQFVQFFLFFHIRTTAAAFSSFWLLMTTSSQQESSALSTIDSPSTQTQHPRKPQAKVAKQRPPMNSHSPVEDEGIIRCICGYDEDDGFTIQASLVLIKKLLFTQHERALSVKNVWSGSTQPAFAFRKTTFPMFTFVNSVVQGNWMWTMQRKCSGNVAYPSRASARKPTIHRAHKPQHRQLPQNPLFPPTLLPLFRLL